MNCGIRVALRRFILLFNRNKDKLKQCSLSFGTVVRILQFRDLLSNRVRVRGHRGAWPHLTRSQQFTTKQTVHVAVSMALSYGYSQAGGGHVPDDVDTEAANWFAVLDENQSGKINATELQQALMNSDWSHFNEESCRLMISMFDRDDCGDVDIDGFKALWGYVQQWRRIFEQFDSDRSGAIDLGEFTIALQQMGYTLSPEFIKLVITKFDRETKSRLTFDNFIQACVKLKAVTDTFRDRDANMEGSIHVNYEELITMAILHFDY